MNVYIHVYLRFGGNSRLVIENYKKKKPLKKIYNLLRRLFLLKNPQDICF